MKDKSIREMKVLSDLLHVLYFLQAAEHLYEATLAGKRIKPVTIKEAEAIADIIRLLFPDRDVSPMEFLKTTNEKANEAIQSYSEYKRWMDKYPGNKRSLEGFCKWYTYDASETASMKLSCYYVVIIAGAIICKRAGKISELEFKEAINLRILKDHQFFFGFTPRSLASTYFKVRNKIMEIEKKIISRDPEGNTGFECCLF